MPHRSATAAMISRPQPCSLGSLSGKPAGAGPGWGSGGRGCRGPGPLDPGWLRVPSVTSILSRRRSRSIATVTVPVAGACRTEFVTASLRHSTASSQIADRPQLVSRLAAACRTGPTAAGAGVI